MHKTTALTSPPTVGQAERDRAAVEATAVAQLAREAAQRPSVAELLKQ